MSTEIKTVRVNVQHGQGDQGRAPFVYTTAVGAQTARSAPFPRRALQAEIKRLREQVTRLVERAVEGKKRDGLGVEAQAKRLSEMVLPEGGLLRFLNMGLHPQFPAISDGEAVPWEVLHDRYFTCCGADEPHEPVFNACLTADQPAYACGRCKRPMTLETGWLALHRHISYQTYAGAGRESRQSVGNRFLLVLNPTGDLCAPAVDPGGACARHGEELQALLERRGYAVTVLAESGASRDAVSEELADPRTVGLYYFGHGESPANEEGQLVLAGKEPLYASDIASINPGIQFVFLNACHGGTAAGPQDGDQKPATGVAQSFVEGDLSKVVIAPNYKIHNTQAARAAGTFFARAVAGEPLGAALAAVRHESHRRYADDNEPDVSWLAYRFFGLPDRTLPPPDAGRAAVTVPVSEPGPAAATAPPPPPAPPRAPRVFTPDGAFHLDAFGFNAEDVFVRAVRRRNDHDRSRLTPADLLAGLVRKGDLTRDALRRHGVPDPDALYDQIRADREPPEPDEKPPLSLDDAIPKEPMAAFFDAAAFLEKLLGAYTVKARDEFRAAAVDLLERADQISRARSGTADRPISERDVLEALTAGGAWPAGVRVPLPPVEAVHAWVTRTAFGAETDGNGQLALDFLDPAARTVVKTAHAQAQQCGSHREKRPTVPQRLVCAAFLTEANEELRQFLRPQATDPGKLAEHLLELSTEGPPESFGLSPETGARVVVPMLTEARALAGNPAAVTQLELFRAFCRVAGRDFKDWLRQLPAPLALDLDALARRPYPHLEPYRARLEPAAWNRLADAADRAHAQGRGEIRTPHLFAALVAAGAVLLHEKASGKPIAPAKAVTVFDDLMNPPDPKERVPTPADVRLGSNAEKLLTRAEAGAAAAGRRRAGEADIATAAAGDATGIIAKCLDHLARHGVEVQVRADPKPPVPPPGTNGKPH